jgi:hypothetical protein
MEPKMEYLVGIHGARRKREKERRFGSTVNWYGNKRALFRGLGIFIEKSEARAFMLFFFSIFLRWVHVNLLSTKNAAR